MNSTRPHADLLATIARRVLVHKQLPTCRRSSLGHWLDKGASGYGFERLIFPRFRLQPCEKGLVLFWSNEQGHGVAFQLSRLMRAEEALLSDVFCRPAKKGKGKKKQRRDEDDEDDEFVFRAEEDEAEEIDTPTTGRKSRLKKRPVAARVYE